MIQYKGTQESQQMVTTTEHRLPSHWAAALINGDTTGMEDQEIDAMTSTLKHLGVNSSSCLDVTDYQDFEHPPSYIPWLLAGAYATFSFA